MARSPWSKPAQVPRPSDAELAAARERAAELAPIMRVGATKGLRANIIAGVNARLEQQLVKVEFVGVKRDQLADMISAIEAGTHAVCVQRHGSTATFFRRHPNKSFP